MYRPRQSMRLEDLKKKGFNPKTILDIGAHTGQFYEWAKDTWPSAFIWMIEANECHEIVLKNIVNNSNDRYTIATLGDLERNVTFYTRSDKPHTEGASYYKETNYHDIPQLVMEIPKTLQTLDNIFTEDSMFDFIKMDTQGSELDIIKGGQRICKKAKYILLEVAVIEYNEKAPLENEIILFMENFGFKEFFTIGEHFNGEQLVQKDIVFKNLNIK
mgnify:CR=1 FL=1|tara:strand:- start:3123 stop:3770 length:648 start_codon:yes stop_codon:yes gene_type:complete